MREESVEIPAMPLLVALQEVTLELVEVDYAAAEQRTFAVYHLLNNERNRRFYLKSIHD